MVHISIPETRVAPRGLPPLDQIKFGKFFTDYYFTVDYSKGRWHDPRIELLSPISIHPGAVVFHYSQAVFEGMKAFRQQNGDLALFRPEMNLRRLNVSADRLCIPQVPEDLFLSAVNDLVDFEREYVPQRPGSLYLRPTIIGTEPCVKVSSSEEFRFFVLALPSGDYFGATSAPGIEVLVAKSVARSGPRGLGNVKASANYAGTLQVIEKARKQGCAQVLFLDACAGSSIEELGGMNIFFVADGGKTLLTPPLAGTILPGVTRDSILHLARGSGMTVREEEISLDQVLDGFASGAMTEALACGTAAVITNISAFHFEDGRKVELPAPVSVGANLRRRLVDIQYGAAADPGGWIRPVTRRSR